MYKAANTVACNVAFCLIMEAENPHHLMATAPMRPSNADDEGDSERRAAKRQRLDVVAGHYTPSHASLYEDVMGEDYMANMHKFLDDADLVGLAQVNRKSLEQVREEWGKRLRHAKQIPANHIVELLHARCHTICVDNRPQLVDAPIEPPPFTPTSSTGYERCGVLGNKIVAAFHRAIESAARAAPEGWLVRVVCTARLRKLSLWNVARTGAGRVRKWIVKYRNEDGVVVYNKPGHMVGSFAAVGPNAWPRFEKMNINPHDYNTDTPPYLNNVVALIVADFIDMAMGMSIDAIGEMLRKHCRVETVTINYHLHGNIKRALFTPPDFPDAIV